VLSSPISESLGTQAQAPVNGVLQYFSTVPLLPIAAGMKGNAFECQILLQHYNPVTTILLSPEFRLHKTLQFSGLVVVTQNGVLVSAVPVPSSQASDVYVGFTMVGIEHEEHT
jgi:hypothetical protein